MTHIEVLFDLGSKAVLPFWAAMVLAPKARVTRTLMAGPWIFAGIAITYGALVLPNLGQLQGQTPVDPSVTPPKM